MANAKMEGRVLREQYLTEFSKSACVLQDILEGFVKDQLEIYKTLKYVCLIRNRYRMHLDIYNRPHS